VHLTKQHVLNVTHQTSYTTEAVIPNAQLDHINKPPTVSAVLLLVLNVPVPAIVPNVKHHLTFITMAAGILAQLEQSALMDHALLVPIQIVHHVLQPIRVAVSPAQLDMFSKKEFVKLTVIMDSTMIKLLINVSNVTALVQHAHQSTLAQHVTVHYI
jgi:hypothetical protein